MRLQRIGLILFSVYLVFIVGGYAQRVPEIRWFNHIVFTVLAAGWLGYRIWKRRNLPLSPLNGVIFALLAVSFAVIPFSLDPRMSLEAMWSAIVSVTLFFFVVNAFHYAQDDFILELVFFSTALVVFLSFLQIGSAFFGWGLVRGAGQGWIDFLGTGIPLPLTEDMRITLPFGVSTQTAGFVAPMIVISCAYAIAARKLNRVLLIILLICLSIILFLTFSRGGLVSLGVGLLSLAGLYIIQIDRIQALITRRNLLIVGVIGVAMVMMAGLVLTVAGGTGRISGDRLRFDLWRSATDMIVDHPVTGVGSGLYGRALRDYRDPAIADDRISTAHNLYLTVIAERGLGVAIVLVVGAIIIGRRWWVLQQATPRGTRRYHLLNGMLAALIGLAVHNLFDTLTARGLITLGIVMIVYCTVEPAQSRLYAKEAHGHRMIASIFWLIVVGYGIWFVAVVDRAHRHFQNSLNPDFNQLIEAQTAHNIDPALGLYEVQIAYLIGRDAYNNPIGGNLAEAIALHEAALADEPTWQVGMMNLAALYIENDDPEQASQWMNRAREIAPRQQLDFQWARLAELTDTAPDEAIIAAYNNGIRRSQMGYLPLSNFWTQTDLRRQVLTAYIEGRRLDLQYRITRAHFPEQLASLVPATPETGAEWWVVGEHALTINGDVDSAIEAFTNAIDLHPTNGDYYASRARAYRTINHEAALRDLSFARFLGTNDEYPNVIAASLTDDEEERETLLQRAVPGYVLPQGYEAVVFGGRTAQMIPYATVRPVGRGDTALAPWYALAEAYESEGEIERAIQIYQLIRLNAPEDNRAAVALERLE